MKNFSKKTIKHLSYISFVFAKRHNCWSVGCGCYDSDYECTMSSYDNKRYKYRYDRKYKKEIKKSIVVITMRRNINLERMVLWI